NRHSDLRSSSRRYHQGDSRPQDAGEQPRVLQSGFKFYSNRQLGGGSHEHPRAERIAMSKIKHLNLDDIDEAQACIRQRQSLTEVRQFLLGHGASEDLIEAVDLAPEDNEQWAIEDVEDA